LSTSASTKVPCTSISSIIWFFTTKSSGCSNRRTRSS
jgi:hypothetical protein